MSPFIISEQRRAAEALTAVFRVIKVFWKHVAAYATSRVVRHLFSTITTASVNEIRFSLAIWLVDKFEKGWNPTHRTTTLHGGAQTWSLSINKRPFDTGPT